jgi:DNA mismatch repair ATPase MutS
MRPSPQALDVDQTNPLAQQKKTHDTHTTQLVDKGYRVARVEQTETPEAMKEHNKNVGKGQKVRKDVGYGGHRVGGWGILVG